MILFYALAGLTLLVAVGFIVSGQPGLALVTAIIGAVLCLAEMRNRKPPGRRF